MNNKDITNRFEIINFIQDTTSIIEINKINEIEKDDMSKNLYDISFSKMKKKKKRCKICRKKKKHLFDLEQCEFCSNTFCYTCKCPYYHKCDNIEEVKKRDKKKLAEKLNSANCNFKKIDSI
jgi:hypothetical protein